MKATGIVRLIDKLGRIVIPMEVRRTMRIKEGDPLELFIDQDRIIFRKYQIACALCGSTEEQETMIEFGDALVCLKCRRALAKAFAKGEGAS